MRIRSTAARPSLCVFGRHAKPGMINAWSVQKFGLPQHAAVWTARRLPWLDLNLVRKATIQRRSSLGLMRQLRLLTQAYEDLLQLFVSVQS